MNIRLVKLSKDYKKHLIDMMDEWSKAGEKIVPSAIGRNDYYDFNYYLGHLELKEEVNGKVDGVAKCFVGVSEEPVQEYDIEKVEYLILTSGKKWPYYAHVM